MSLESCLECKCSHLGAQGGFVRFGNALVWPSFEFALKGKFAWSKNDYNSARNFGGNTITTPNCENTLRRSASQSLSPDNALDGRVQSNNSFEKCTSTCTGLRQRDGNLKLQELSVPEQELVARFANATSSSIRWIGTCPEKCYMLEMHVQPRLASPLNNDRMSCCSEEAFENRRPFAQCC